MKDKSIKLKSDKMRGIFSITKKELITSKTLSIKLKSEDVSAFNECKIGDIVKIKSIKDVSGKSSCKAKFIIKDVEIKENKLQLELSVDNAKDLRIEKIMKISEEDKVCVAVKSIINQIKMKRHSLKHKYKHHAPIKSKMEFIHGEYDPNFEKHMKKYKLKRKKYKLNSESDSKHGKHKHHHSKH